MTELFASLLRHAELYGADGVLEAAEELDPGERARLRLELDALEAARKSGRFTIGTRRRRRPEETVELAGLLRHEQGWVVSAIADKLGVSDDYVRKCLSRYRKAENGGSNPHG